MKLLQIEDVHLTYPPRFRRGPDTGGDDDSDAGDGLVDGEQPEEPQEEEQARPGSDQPTPALRGVSLEVSEGDALAVLGLVGAGRSTLLSVICGLLRPDQGRALIRGYASGIIAAGAGFARDLSIEDNIVRNAQLTGMSRSRAKELVPQIAEFAGFGQRRETMLHSLTRQEVRRLGYSVALHAEPTIFVADEDLALGTKDMKEAAFERMASYPGPGRALVVATNRPELVKRLCTRSVVLQDGRVVFDGSVEDGLLELRRIRAGADAAPTNPDDQGGPDDE